MTVALKSNYLSRTARRTPDRQSSIRSTGAAVAPVMSSQRIMPTQPVTVLPNRRAVPAWMRSLSKLHRSSSVITFSLMTAALGAYGLTVYSQQQWSREYTKLETLQQKERQLMTSSQLLKHQLAQQAELPGSGLVPPNPANMIFLKPAPERSPLQPPAPAADLEAAQQGEATPVGY